MSRLDPFSKTRVCNQIGNLVSSLFTLEDNSTPHNEPVEEKKEDMILKHEMTEEVDVCLTRFPHKTVVLKLILSTTNETGLNWNKSWAFSFVLLREYVLEPIEIQYRGRVQIISFKLLPSVNTIVIRWTQHLNRCLCHSNLIPLQLVVLYKGNLEASQKTDTQQGRLDLMGQGSFSLSNRYDYIDIDAMRQSIAFAIQQGRRSKFPIDKRALGLHINRVIATTNQFDLSTEVSMKHMMLSSSVIATSYEISSLSHTVSSVYMRDVFYQHGFSVQNKQQYTGVYWLLGEKSVFFFVRTKIRRQSEKKSIQGTSINKEFETELEAKDEVEVEIEIEGQSQKRKKRSKRKLIRSSDPNTPRIHSDRVQDRTQSVGTVSTTGKDKKQKCREEI